LKSAWGNQAVDSEIRLIPHSSKLQIDVKIRKFSGLGAQQADLQNSTEFDSTKVD